MTLMPRAVDLSQWGWTISSDLVRGNDPEKPPRNPDCGLQLVHMKPESIVIVHHHGTVKFT